MFSMRFTSCTVLVLCCFLGLHYGLPQYGVQRFTSGDKIMACYIKIAHTPEMPASYVDPFVCTHLITISSAVSPNGIKLFLSTDLEEIRALTALKKMNPQLKIMLSLGGGFKTVVGQNEGIITNFCEKAMPFLERENIDGLDIDWEQPSSSDKQHFITFIKILSKFLKSSNLSLSFALPWWPGGLVGYDIDTLNTCADFMTIMNYDYHGYNPVSNKVTAYNSPLYSPLNESVISSTESTLSYFLYLGFLKSKILMGIPAYGRSWTLAKASEHGLHSPAVGVGPPGPISKTKGYYTYPDFCTAKKQGFTLVEDKYSIAEYLYNKTTWVAYNGMFTIIGKMEWMKQRGLAGVGVFAYDHDDYKGICGEGRVPFLWKIHSLL